ncbi:MAG: flippase [Halobacteriota archaeon]|nr:flippase [Halobacteriota archaeon]
MVQLGRNVLKNSIYNSAGTLITSATGLIITVLLARLLSPEDYGLFYLALSVGFLLLTFTDPGINATLIRYVSHAIGNNEEKLARSYFKYLFRFNLLLTLFVSITLIILAEPLAVYVFDKPSLYLPLVVVGFFVLFTSLRNFFRCAFIAFHEFKYNMVNFISYECLRLVTIPAFIFLGYAVFGAIMGVCLSSLGALLVLIYFLLKKHPFLLKGAVLDIDRKKILKFLGFLTIGSISGVIFAYVDSIMIGIFLPAESVGFYRIGFNIVFAVAGLISIANVLFPVFTQLESIELRNAFNRVFKYSMTFSIPFAFGLIFISENLVKLVFGIEYLPAALPMQFLSLIILIATTSGLFINILNAKEKPKYTAAITIVSMSMNVLLNYFMILEYGVMGAAMATVISRYFNFIALVYMSKKVLDIFPGWASFCKPIFSSIGMVTFLYLIPSPDTLFIGIAEVMVGSIIYITVLFLIKGLSMEDVKYFREILGI